MWREKNREGERDIDYMELARVIMEADQSWDGQSELASNQEKVVHGVAPNPSSKAWGPESWWCSSSPNAGRFKTQEEPEFQFEFKGRNYNNISAERQSGRRSSPFCQQGQLFGSLRVSTDWMRPITLEVALSFIQPTNSSVSLIQKHSKWTLLSAGVAAPLAGPMWWRPWPHRGLWLGPP